jgi:hypothetical protein
VKADPKEERLVLQAPQFRHSFVANDTVGICVVCYVRCLVRGTSSVQRSLRTLPGVQLTLIVLPQLRVGFLEDADGGAFHISPDSGGLGMPRACAPCVRILVGMMIDLPQRDRFVSVVLEMARDAHQIRPYGVQRSVQIRNPRRVGPRTRKQTHARRSTHRLLAIRPIEPQPSRRQFVDIWREDPPVPVAPQFRTQIVHCDEQDIRLPRRCTDACCTRNRRRHSGAEKITP